MATKARKPKTQKVSDFELKQITENTARVQKLQEVASQLQEQTRLIYSMIDDRYGCNLLGGEHSVTTEGEIILNSQDSEETDD